MMADLCQCTRLDRLESSRLDSYGFGLWALELKTTGASIGDCGLTYQDVEGSPQLEVGYHVMQRERRKGYATEAARACLDSPASNTRRRGRFVRSSISQERAVVCGGRPHSRRLAAGALQGPARDCVLHDSRSMAGSELTL